MAYRESIISESPISFWPLDDDSSLGVIKEATGKGTDGSYAGSIFDKSIPLVANGKYGTRLLNSTSRLHFPLPGASGSGTTWENAHIWSIGKEKQSFSVELYIKANNSDTTIDSEVVVFGKTSPSIYGIYLLGNKIYFKPDPNSDYKVSYQVPDWNRRFHIVASYTSSEIRLIINGTDVVSKKYEGTFQFSDNPGHMTSYGSAYLYTVDAVAIYKYAMGQVNAVDHTYLSRKTLTKNTYYSKNSQVYYLPNNDECLIASKFYNNWTDFTLNNIVLNSSGQPTLRYINDQEVSGSGSITFSTVSSRSSATLGASQYLDISSITSLSGRGTAISVSFYYNSASAYGAILSAEDINGARGLTCYTDASKLYITAYGSTTEVTGLATGWHEILVDNNSSGTSVYLDGVLKHNSITSMRIIDRCYIGQAVGLFTTSPISWVAVKANTSDVELTDYTLYGELTDFTLKLNGNLKWSQKGSAEGLIYVPEVDYHGSLAFYTASSENVSVTYNGGLAWPKEATMPTLLDNDSNQVNIYNVKVDIQTSDSKEDLPILFELGLYTYTQGLKRVIAENSNEQATIVNIDDAIIYDNNLEMLDRLDRCGIRLAGNSYLTIPSQSKNTDQNEVGGTKSISIIFKLNEALTGTKYILKSGTKALYWDGTAWQYPGFNNIYINGQSGVNATAMTDDWVHVILTSTSKIDAGTAIYVGADNTGANQTDITLGAFAMAAYTLDAFDAETEYETFVGYPEQTVATENFTLQVFDYGLQAYNYSVNRA